MQFSFPEARSFFETYVTAYEEAKALGKPIGGSAPAEILQANPDALLMHFSVGQLKPLATISDYFLMVSVIGASITAWRYFEAPEELEKSATFFSLTGQARSTPQELMALATDLSDPDMAHLAQCFAGGYAGTRAVSGMQRTQSEFQELANWRIWNKRYHGSSVVSPGLLSLKKRLEKAYKVMRKHGLTPPLAQESFALLAQFEWPSVIMIADPENIRTS